ncbi:MAG: hypothetical protein ACE367_19735 [Acidimicrobiales bacterium]
METPDVVLEELRTVLSDAGDIPLSCWSRDELAGWLCGLQDIRAQIDGLLCAAAAEGQSAALYQLDRARSLRQFVALRTRTNPADVGADLALGRWLAGFPVVARALAAGRITRRHAVHLRELDNPRTHQHLLDGIDYLTDAAHGCSWQGFIEACNEWLTHADTDGKLPDETERSRRCSTKKRADGTVSGQFNLDTIGGDAVRTAIEREAHRLFCIDADPSNPEWKLRNHTQRMADALVNLITRGALRTDRTVGAPLVHVVVGLEILEEAMCRKAATDTGIAPIGPDGQPLGDDLGIDASNPLRRCELVDGTPLHPNQVLALLGVATIRRIVLDADGEILHPRASRKSLNMKRTAAGAACCEHGCDANQPGCRRPHHPWPPTSHPRTPSRCSPAPPAQAGQRAASTTGAKSRRRDQRRRDPATAPDTTNRPTTDTNPDHLPAIRPHRATPDAERPTPRQHGPTCSPQPARPVGPMHHHP